MTDDTQSTQTQRQHERKDILFTARLLVGSESHECEIVNISHGGANIRVKRTLSAGDMVVLDIEPFGAFNMEVRWYDNGNAGVRFNDDPAKVGELILAIATYA